MSYICDKCGKATKNKERLTLIPTSFREVEYLNIMLKKAKEKRVVYSYEEAEKLKVEGWVISKKVNTKGSERVSELKICPRCVKEEK